MPVASISWTITHEEIFREPHEYCVERSRNCRLWYHRKLFYALTCEYCLSHYIAIFFVAVTRYKLLFDGWQGYLIAVFGVTWVANHYMSLFGRLRQDIKKQKIEITKESKDLEEPSFDREGAGSVR